MNSQIQLIAPKWFIQDELHIIETIVSRTSADTGIVIAGENFDATKRCQPTVRLYMMQLMDGQYEITKELDAFQFDTAEEAQQFCAKLPDMTAIDLIMLMNKEEPVFSI